MKTILFYYCFLIALFISISGILTSQNTSALLFQLLFIPITIYFSYSILTQFTHRNMKPDKPLPLNRGVIIVTIALFLFLFCASINRILKTNKNSKNTQTEKTTPPTLTPVVKPTTMPFLMAKSDYVKDIINVRQFSSSASKKIGILDTTKKYQIISKNDQWYEIVFDKNIHGFVSDKFVEIQ